MELFRISAAKYEKQLIASGSPNRWNKKGELVIYAGSSRSLATLELVVHRNSIVPETQYQVMIISVADYDDLVNTVKIIDLPKYWQKLQAYSTLQNIGSRWYNNKESLILKVPSVIIPLEYNFIINTKHKKFDQYIQLLRNENYFWDDRLV